MVGCDIDKNKTVLFRFLGDIAVYSLLTYNNYRLFRERF
ncbi:hypothetical protein CRENPOLYSF1_610034 [Crenothrix polyspora]|uniref:Uncharacterized protein n=1 Tax=Crenothrix polyspora TaxID=360316 RepID=A0A1R4HFH7_9GAMM|nr:hypothetical protein CRENPOLYSF1_610034 [Crenothrix polyspora]